MLDELVTEKIMMALEPAALELSLQPAGDLEKERQRLDCDWRQRLERSRYEVDRAHRFALTLAEKLQMPKNTLLEWMRRGWVHVMRQLPGYRGRKIGWADSVEIDRLVRLRDAKRRACDPPFPSELTTPKICIPSGDS